MSTTTGITIDGIAVTDLSDYRDALLDFCADCVREQGCSRADVIFTPRSQCQDGSTITACYTCISGHSWICSFRASEPG